MSCHVGCSPYCGFELDGLGIATVSSVVASSVAQVDTAHEGHVVLGPGSSEQHQLLVMAPPTPYPFVEHEFTA